MIDVARSSARPRSAHATPATTVVTARRLAMTTAGSTRRASHTCGFPAGSSAALRPARPDGRTIDEATEPGAGVALEGTRRECVAEHEKVADPGGRAPGRRHGTDPG